MMLRHLAQKEVQLMKPAWWGSWAATLGNRPPLRLRDPRGPLPLHPCCCRRRVHRGLQRLRGAWRGVGGEGRGVTSAPTRSAHSMRTAKSGSHAPQSQAVTSLQVAVLLCLRLQREGSRPGVVVGGKLALCLLHSVERRVPYNRTLRCGAAGAEAQPAAALEVEVAEMVIATITAKRSRVGSKVASG